MKQLILKEAKVYLAVRSANKAAAAIKRLEGETKKTAIFIQLDLADLPSVRKAAEAFLAQESRLDILFNNGCVLAPSESYVCASSTNLFNSGVMNCPMEALTVQNHDLRTCTLCLTRNLC